MNNELLKIFAKSRNQIGVATREEVHKVGYWHEAFHCWFVSEEKGINYIYLQLRSHLKKDYPNLLDITAAGHLLADETVQDGVREIKEEIGIDLLFNEVVPLGIINYSISNEHFIDNEIAHVFMYKSDKHFADFILQEEEVAGIVKVGFNDFVDLWLGDRETIKMNGFKVNKTGERMVIDGHVGRDQFVPHPLLYYKTVIQKIKRLI